MPTDDQPSEVSRPVQDDSSSSPDEIENLLGKLRLLTPEHHRILRQKIWRFILAEEDTED